MGNYLIDYQIAIPTYKRYETVCKKTLAYLRKTNADLGRLTLFTADAIEAKRYREALALHGLERVEVVPGALGIGKQRNFIQAYYPDGTPVVSIDDDLAGVFVRTGKTTITTLVDFEGLIQNAFETTKAAGLRLWGIHPVDNPFYMQATVSYDLRYICACFFGFFANSDPRTFVRLEDKEDFERSIRYYILDGGVVRFNWVGPKTNYYLEPGGMQVTRTPERVTASAKWLVRNFPDFCKINRSKKSRWTEVKLKDERGIDKRGKAQAGRGKILNRDERGRAAPEEEPVLQATGGPDTD